MQQRLIRSLVILLTAVPLFVSAQADVNDDLDTRHKLTKKADAYFDAKEYSLAVEIYDKAYSKERDREEKARIAYNSAECYRYVGDYKRAEGNYKKASKIGFGPLADLGYADMLQAQGEYEDAIAAYEVYRALVPDDPRTDIGINSCRQAANWVVEGSLFSVNNIRALNSKQADYAVAFAGRRGREDMTLIVSSMRDDAKGKREDGWMGERFSDLFITEGQEPKRRGRPSRNAEPDPNKEVEWSDLESLSDVINTKDHEGVVTFDSRMRTMYFTKCVQVKNMQMGCAIYSSRQMGQDWAEAEPVAMALDSGASVGHPALSPNDEILYFSGEMAGGKGGKDLYMTTYNRRKRMWDTPVNLDINTRGDELYPFAHGDGYLYFSSNGRVGMGGLDVYRVLVDEEGRPVGEVENMRSPINSEGDDIALRWVPGDNTLKGYVVSNRKGTRGGYDIWEVNEWQKEYEVLGRVTSTKDGSPIEGVQVEVSDKDGVLITLTSDAQGRFEVPKGEMVEGVKYKINLSRKRFLNAIGDVSTEGLVLADYTRNNEEREFIKQFNITLSMDPIEIPIVLPNVFFDLAKADLRPESKVALDTVYNILKRNPNITIGLRSHTDYRGADDDNLDLSQRRADSCVAYLIKRGVPAERLTAQGMGEREPFVIPNDYAGLGADVFTAGTNLTETFIKSQKNSTQEIANQLNRRTDFVVLRDDYEPAVPETTDSNEGGSAEPTTRPMGETVILGPSDRSIGVIARKYKMSVVQLRELNGGLSGARPMPGMVLKVTWGGDYTDFDAEHHQIKRGETLKSISETYGISMREIKDWNDIKNDRELIIGSYLKIK